MHGTNVLRHHENQLAKTTHQQRDSTRNQDGRCTLRSRRLYPLKQQVHPFVFIVPCFREWHTCLRHQENQMAKTTHQKRDSTRNQNDRCTLRSRRLHPLKPQIQPPICGGRLVLAVSTKNKTTGTNTPRTKSISSRAVRLQATQQNRCVLRSRRLHPFQATPPFSSTGFSFRLACSDDCWQQIQPPIAPRNPTEPLCAELQATSPSRAQDVALIYVPIIVGNRFSLRSFHSTRLKFAISIFDLRNTYTRTSPLPSTKTSQAARLHAT